MERLVVTNADKKRKRGTPGGGHGGKPEGRRETRRKGRGEHRGGARGAGGKRQEALKDDLIATEHKARDARALAKIKAKDAAKKARAEGAAWQTSLRAEEVLNRAEELKQKAGRAEKAAEKAVTPAACATVVTAQCQPSAGQQPITLWCSRSGRGPMRCACVR